MKPTDSRLLDVAIDHFGRKGLEGASTRAIAADAGTPMSSITYHFGGKSGLYLAAAEHISATLGERLRPALERVAEICAGGINAGTARASLHTIFGRMVEIMVGDETAAFARFIVREQAEPTEAFDRLYAGIMGQMLQRVAAMLRLISADTLGETDSRVRAMTLVGQILVFRVARATALAATGWNDMGESEAAIIKHAVADNLDAIFDRLEARSSK
ncbi:CerR family C-terminal domain-containing protein [Sphingomonas sp.]|uniref:CerR family C-terminal domain-containing protein n=1 Tax=Sphingomonas sp. TaxID=28214 RepID=UPI003D6D6CD2